MKRTPYHSLRVAGCLALGLLLLSAVGCKSTPKSPPKNTTPVTDTQAPSVREALRPMTTSEEKRMQDQIDAMQDQIRVLGARTDALATSYGALMSPQWRNKVLDARAGASRESERLRYLEATKALLARRLQSLQAELKVYEAFQLSDPSAPRP